MAKLLIALMRDKPLPGKSDVLDVSMDDRVKYALDCIEADGPEKGQAIEFLQKVRDRVDNPELSSKIESALSPKGDADA